jgi:renalase
VRTIVVGAGISGLVAARELAAAGVDVTVLDKGRSVGGRLATRRIGDARLDHGAQFFTVRTPAFQRRVDGWLERGLVSVWNYGFDGALADGSMSTTVGRQKIGDGYPRYVARDGMNSLAKELADGLHVETATMAFAVRPSEAGSPMRWEVAIDDGTSRPADAVVLTCPLPQSFALLVDSEIDLDETLFRTDYDRTIGLLVTLDGPGAIPPPGGIQDADAVFSFIADNQAKGISAVPAITFHANPEWSEAQWDDDEAALAALVIASTPWLGDARIVDCQLKKWRFATPRTVWPDPYWTACESTIVLAGDAFAGPRVEGAHNSGLAAAHALVA